MSGLRDRLREIVRPAGAGSKSDAPARALQQTPTDLEVALGGQWIRRHAFTVERRVRPDARYGDVLVGDIARQLRHGASQLPLLDRRVGPALPLLFFDLETTGLSGGAGTYAFLIGYGWFDGDDSFVTRQHLLVDQIDEQTMLEAAAEELGHAGAIVSYNGKSFDAPVLETRYALHRVEWPGCELPHLDILHPSRRFWGDRESEPLDPRGCSLVALEERILGAVRLGDVPGFEIPGRYFQFLRTGDGSPLEPVFEHNRLDLLSLAGLAGRLLELIAEGPLQNATPDEALALGSVYEQAGLGERAVGAFERAAAGDARCATRVEASRRLARRLRRERRFEEAATWWQKILETPGCPRRAASEATEALAIHHEHRVRDLDLAKKFALQSLRGVESRARQEGVEHRLARLERKLTANERPTFPFSPFSPSRPSCGSRTSERRTSS